MRPVNEVIIHCSATVGDISAAQIDAMHKKRGWIGIGYHYVIRTSGAVEVGRDWSQPGAHVKGRNLFSIGVCLAGGLTDNNKPTPGYTINQWTSLVHVVRSLERAFPGIQVAGHNEYANKACPCFNVKRWWKNVKESTVKDIQRG